MQRPSAPPAEQPQRRRPAVTRAEARRAADELAALLDQPTERETLGDRALEVVRALCAIEEALPEVLHPVLAMAWAINDECVSDDLETHARAVNKARVARARAKGAAEERARVLSLIEAALAETQTFCEPERVYAPFRRIAEELRKVEVK